MGEVEWGEEEAWKGSLTFGYIGAGGTTLEKEIGFQWLAGWLCLEEQDFSPPLQQVGVPPPATNKPQFKQLSLYEFEDNVLWFKTNTDINLASTKKVVAYPLAENIFHFAISRLWL